MDTRTPDEEHSKTQEETENIGKDYMIYKSVLKIQSYMRRLMAYKRVLALKNNN